jgi:ATP-dependent DNA helicase RecQ
VKGEALKVLKTVFGYDDFRPQQWDIIKEVLEDRDALALMPTGGGKSLCFQIPALLKEGAAIVVSPLIALMKDQVEGLVSNGVKATFLNSSQSPEEQDRVMRELEAGTIKMLYVSPEKLVNDHFLSFLQTIKISLIAIDEAHCISSWGHDFRPEYAQVGALRHRFEGVPFIALTATADKLTRKDITTQLALNNPKVFISSFDRPNLSLAVLPGKKRFERIVEFLLTRQEESGIIYCLSRKSTENLSAKLRAQGFSATAYHAGLRADEREKAQEDFINDKVKIVCATVAFGMGIDKSNVRFVIHFNLPKNIEGYYQEIGRAGRDGLASDTILFYSYADVVQLNQFVENSGQKEFQQAKLRRMQDFTEARICRRKILLAYFGEVLPENCGNCDVCKNPPKLFDGTVIAQMALSAIARTSEQEASGGIIEILKGSSRPEMYQKGYHELKTFGVGKSYTFKDWQNFMLQLLSLGFFEVAYDDHNKLRLTPLSKEVLFSKKKVDLVDTAEMEKPFEDSKSVVKPKNISADEELFEILRQVRTKLARDEGKPPYLIFSDATLKSMSLRKPTTQPEMLNISGVGEHKYDLYGDNFTNVILDYVNRNKKKKGDTFKETMVMIEKGMTVPEISDVRVLKETTVYSHIAQLFKIGRLTDISKFIPFDEFKRLETYCVENPKEDKLKPIYEALGSNIDYGKIRLVLEYIKTKK